MRWVTNFPSWVLTQLGVANRGGQEWRPHLLDSVQPVVLVEREQTGALESSEFNDAETISGFAYVGLVSRAAVAGQLSHCQLKVPTTASRVVFIDSILAGGAAAADTIRFGHIDADLTTLSGSWVNRNNSGTVGLAQLRAQTNAAELLDADMVDIILPANTMEWMDFDPPIRLAAGEGYGVRSLNVNTNLFANFFGREYIAS